MSAWRGRRLGPSSCPRPSPTNWPASYVKPPRLSRRRLLPRSAPSRASPGLKSLEQATSTRVSTALAERELSQAEQVWNPNRAASIPLSSTPASIPTRPRTSAICATPSSATPSSACCAPPGKRSTFRTQAEGRAYRFLLLGPLRKNLAVVYRRHRRRECRAQKPPLCHAARNRTGRQRNRRSC